MKQLPSYFDDVQKCARLCEVVQGWIGTPYHHMGENKAGVDCTKLMAFIWIELGLMRKIDSFNYSKDWMVHGNQEIVIQSFTTQLAKYCTRKFSLFRYSPLFKLEFGDIIGFCLNTKGLTNHTALKMSNDDLVHAIAGKNVHITRFSNWKDKATYVFRCH